MGNLKGVYIRGNSRMKSWRRKEIATIMALVVILQKNATSKSKIGRESSNVLHT